MARLRGADVVGLVDDDEIDASAAAELLGVERKVLGRREDDIDRSAR